MISSIGRKAAFTAALLGLALGMAACASTPLQPQQTPGPRGMGSMGKMSAEHHKMMQEMMGHMQECMSDRADRAEMLGERRQMHAHMMEHMDACMRQMRTAPPAGAGDSKKENDEHDHESH